jgi:hypothetical protein
MQAQLGYWQNDTTTKDQSIYAIKNITLYQDYKTVIPMRTVYQMVMK